MRLALVALLLLAGCVAPPAQDGDIPGATNVLPWELIECRYLVAWSPADPAALQARVPEGFSIPTMGVVPGGPRVPVAQLGTEIFECTSGSGLDGNVTPMIYGSMWYGVIPSDDARVEGIDLYMMKEDILVPDAPRRELLAARGMSVHEGSISWEASTGPLGQGAALELDGFGRIAFALEAPQTAPSPEGGPFIEFTPGTNGLAAWQAEYSWDSAEYATGRGSITWPAGTWAADAVGVADRPVPAQFHMGTWSFRGTLTLPDP